MFATRLTLASLALAFSVASSHAQISQHTVTPSEIDYANARPAAQPKLKASPGSLLDLMQTAARHSAHQGEPKVFQGGKGDGERVPDEVPTSRVKAADGDVTSQEFGSSGHPFTTSVEPDAGADLHAIAGKLFFRSGAESFVCSGALIKPGIVATAAHCVADFGVGFYNSFEFIPGYQKGKAPFGRYKASKAFALTSYLNGTDSCAVSGIVCQNDVALLALKPLKGKLPGARTGWFGYGLDGYGFNSSRQALITQLGYPVGLNNGERQERTDSQGVFSAVDSNNTVIGSLQTGGSSGGPWLVNFGFKPKLTGTTIGTFAGRNIIVGTTSWGYTSTAVKQQGASPFTSANIGALVDAACAKYPNRC